MKDIDYVFIVFIVFLLGVSMFLGGNLDATNERVAKLELQAPTISEEEKYFNQLTEDIIKCESSGIENAIGDGGLAYGVAQFHRETFEWLCKLSGKDLDYYSAEDQKELLRWALENWHGRLWTCYSIIKGF